MRGRWLMCVVLLLGSYLAPAGASARMFGRVAFEPCELSRPRGVERIRAECARFDVPEDPGRPQGRKLRLRVALLPARVGEAEPDPVVLLAGGPGQSAVDAYISAQAALEPLRARRHVLLVDQRGTGESNRLGCEDKELGSAESLAPEAMREAARRCLADTRAIADPRFYTTGDYLRDLEAVRQALGMRTVNLIGASYGTRVALDYLRRHPQVVRSVVLDSVVPPELPLLREHAQNLDDGLRNIFAACLQSDACRDRFGDPGATLARLSAQLAKRPARVDVVDPFDFSHRSEQLGAYLLATIVRLYAYQPESAALLPLLLDEAEQGRLQPLMAQGLLLLDQLEGQMAHGMELSVVCSEDAPWLGADEADDGATLLGNALIEGVRAQCGVWPRGEVPEDFKQPVRSDQPVLILSGEYDPVTPPRYGEQVARTLNNSRHIVAPGQGHTVMIRGCLPRLIRDFVEDLQPQGLDTACVDSMGAWPAFLGYGGFAP